MKERNPGNHENRSIAPRLRKGEVMPESEDGKVVTRLHGDLVQVPAREDGELFVGNSPYTERQLRELANMASKGKEQSQLPQSGDIFLA